MVFPAVAEGTSLADCAGVASSVVGAEAGPSTVAEVASPADIAGAVSPAVAGVASPADIVGAASPAVAEVASSADIVGAASPAVAEVASSADIVGAASSTDPAGDDYLSGMNDVKCEHVCLADSSYPDIDFPHNNSPSRSWRERDPDIVRAPGSVAVLPTNKVGAIGTGASWF